MTLVFLSTRMDMDLALHRSDDFLRRIGKIVGGNDREAGFRQYLLALVDVGAFEPHHDRYRQRYFFRGFDNAGRDDVATHDATEDVDQNPLHVLVGENDLERRRYFFLRRAAADIE